MLPSHSLSAPPHALQIVVLCLVAAFVIAARYLPSPASTPSHVAVGPSLPFSFASQHFCSALLFELRNADVAFPMLTWHLLRSPVVAGTRLS